MIALKTYAELPLSARKDLVKEMHYSISFTLTDALCELPEGRYVFVCRTREEMEDVLSIVRAAGLTYRVQGSRINTIQKDRYVLTDKYAIINNFTQ